MVKLRRLKIEELRNVEPTELTFGDGFNVLLGLNATGKTTLLELVAAVMSSDFSALREEAFAVEYELWFEQGTITASVRNKEAPQEEIVEPAAGRAARRTATKAWRGSAQLTVRVCGVSFSAEVKSDSSALHIKSERASVSQPWFSLFDSNLLNTVLFTLSQETAKEDLQADLIAMWAHVSQSASLCRFDEALDYFWLINHGPAGPGAPPSRMPTLYLSRSREDSRASALPLDHRSSLPDEIIEGALDRVARGSTLDSFSIHHRALPFLAKVVEVLQIKSAELHLRLLEKKVSTTSEETELGDLRFIFERRDGSKIPHERLSFGQKRLLAFFYYLSANPHTVVADELVDGLHHRWIEECLGAIGDRQAFLASQNPLLLDFLEFDSAEQVRSSFVVCRLEADGDLDRMVWSNLSAYDAERFFEAYEVGIQHVSEILRTKGLW